MNVSEGPDAFADLLSSFVNSPLEEKQLLLETVNPIERIELLVDWIQRDLGKATVDRELQRQIQTSIDRRERENYLREQLRVIQDELGDANPGEHEADTYRERVEALPLTDDYKLQLRREVNRLSQLSPSSSDYSVLRGHLDTILQVPWKEKTEDRLDLKKAEEILNEKHHALDKVKERVLEFLAVMKLKGDLKGPILCFVGPPGVGKTSLGAAIAEALGRKFVRMAVGGVTDESEIRGHRKTYIGAMQSGEMRQRQRTLGSWLAPTRVLTHDAATAGRGACLEGRGARGGGAEGRNTGRRLARGGRQTAGKGGPCDGQPTYAFDVKD